MDSKMLNYVNFDLPELVGALYRCMPTLTAYMRDRPRSTIAKFSICSDGTVGINPSTTFHAKVNTEKEIADGMMVLIVNLRKFLNDDIKFLELGLYDIIDNTCYFYVTEYVPCNPITSTLL